jgi:septum formation protein
MAFVKGVLQETVFADCTKVWFETMSDTEIHFYIENYQPFDKAGSYGAQDWLGLTQVVRIEGSYTNVIGLPTAKVYAELVKFCDSLIRDSGVTDK